ncbi:MAG TPA: N-acetylmuramoyl-L-alanine amidase [Lacibacter sp.]|nr:N-acetylmuramoyl-L-alanine amidase [Lacibacter sp.]HMO90469.1 N-acetylmuramoyl-L-alanine amidase [Lacibacter sp.]HMP86718.1 N-acetylmuramoyl-L-alanine amidase [Lacibacter sp.]
MWKPFFLFLVLLAVYAPAGAQDRSLPGVRVLDTLLLDEAVYRKAEQRGGLVELVLPARPFPAPSGLSFHSLSFGWNEPAAASGETTTHWEIRYAKEGQVWGDWQAVQPDHHAEGEPLRYSRVSELMLVDSSYRFYQLRLRFNQSDGVPLLLFLNQYSPAEAAPRVAGRTGSGASIPVAGRVNTCACPQPAFTSRTGWGCPQAPWSPSLTTPTHLIVHHSAGGNTSSNWDGVVLAIWNQHVNTNGWSDIGYNWLIAPSGVLYEGRQGSSTQNVTGAHFCSTNTRTMGVCLLGTYTTATITPEARNTLIATLAWKGCELNIDPTGSSVHLTSGLTLNHVSGHRQGCSTECPGNTLFSDLTAIGFAAKGYQDNGCRITAVPGGNGAELLTVLPNPTAGSAWLRLQVTGVQELRYQLYSSDGRLLHSAAPRILSGTVVMEIEGLREQPAGTYLLRVWIGGKGRALPVVKQ